MDRYADYISFRDGKQYTILKSNIIINESFTVLPEDINRHRDISIDTTVRFLPLVDPSADEFNSSIIAYDTVANEWTYRYMKDTCHLYIVYRHQPIGGRSSVWIGRLHLDNTTIMDAKVLLTDPFIHYEDPHLFIYQNNLYVSYSRWGSATISSYNDPLSIIQLGFTHVKYTNPGFELGKEYIPPFGNNYTPGKAEKNWGFFEKNRQLFCLYNISPFTIFKYDMETNFCRLVRTLKTQTSISLRGGTPPIYVNGAFVSFIHCSDYLVYSLQMKFDQTIGKLTHISEFSILAAFNTFYQDTNCVTRNGILFPCGAVYDTDNKKYIVSMGYNDKRNVICYINRL